MKIFVSWSGARSKAVAELLNGWIKCVIQATQPWISTRDIDRGALWFSAITEQLKDTSVGIVCLTHENKNKPWILFEAGALARGLSSNRVCTFLIDLNPADLEDPLAQFNHTSATRESMWELARTINGCLSSGALDERILIEVFETYWPKFETQFADALKQNLPTEKVEPRSEANLLGEILENTRALNQRINSIERRWDGSRVRRDHGEKSYISAADAKATIASMMSLGIGDDVIISNLTGRGPPIEWIEKEIMRTKAELTSAASP